MAGIQTQVHLSPESGCVTIMLRQLRKQMAHDLCAKHTSYHGQCSGLGEMDLEGVN